MIRSAAPTTPSPGAKRGTPPISTIVIVGLLAIVVVATGVGYLGTSTGPINYACLSISHQGSNVDVKTTGLVHFLKSQYYVTCTEGSSLPTNTLNVGCLTITPQPLGTTIGSGYSATSYYYLSATGRTITLVGAPAPTNGTEIITPSRISLSISC